MQRHVQLVVLVSAMLLAGCSHALLAPMEVRNVRVDEYRTTVVSHGRSLRVDVYEPPGTQRHAAAIILHGSGGIHPPLSSDANRYAHALALHGIRAFVLHYFDGTDDFIAGDSVETANFAEWVSDVRAAVEWVSKKATVQQDHVSLVGISLGAWLAVGVAAEDASVHRIVLFGAGLEPFLRDHVTRLPSILMFHGTSDDVVPISEADSLAAFARRLGVPVRYHVLKGEEHGLSDSSATKALVEAAQFIKR